MPSTCLGATKDALLDGQVSEAQGQIIANAAKVNPDAERNLIKKAKRTNHQQLREEAQKAKAAADRDPAATHRRIHADRRLSRHTDAEGAWNLHARGTVADGSIISSELDRLTDEIFRARGKAGTRECRDAYAFDALVEMARRSSGLRHGDAPEGKGTATAERTAAPGAAPARRRGAVARLRRGRRALRGHRPRSDPGRGRPEAARRRRPQARSSPRASTSLASPRSPEGPPKRCTTPSSGPTHVHGRGLHAHDRGVRPRAWRRVQGHPTHAARRDRALLPHPPRSPHPPRLGPGRRQGKRPMVAPDDPRHPANAPPPATGPPADAGAEQADLFTAAYP